MEARIVGFRKNRYDVYPNYCIIKADEETPGKLIGQKVFWKTPSGDLIRGKIVRIHGRDSLLARFKKGLPGFAVGQGVEIGTNVHRPVLEPQRKKRTTKPPVRKVEKKDS